MELINEGNGGTIRIYGAKDNISKSISDAILYASILTFLHYLPVDLKRGKILNVVVRENHIKRYINNRFDWLLADVYKYNSFDRMVDLMPKLGYGNCIKDSTDMRLTVPIMRPINW